MRQASTRSQTTLHTKEVTPSHLHFLGGDFWAHPLDIGAFVKRRSVIRTILAAITGASWNNAQAQSISFVEYLGERIPLTKKYRDFYEYKTIRATSPTRRFDE